VKTALYQGDGRLISGVVRCGRAFLPPARWSEYMLGGEGGYKSARPERILGGSIPPIRPRWGIVGELVGDYRGG